MALKPPSPRSDCTQEKGQGERCGLSQGVGGEDDALQAKTGIGNGKHWFATGEERIREDKVWCSRVCIDHIQSRAELAWSAREGRGGKGRYVLYGRLDRTGQAGAS